MTDEQRVWIRDSKNKKYLLIVPIRFFFYCWAGSRLVLQRARQGHSLCEYVNIHIVIRNYFAVTPDITILYSISIIAEFYNINKTLTNARIKGFN